MRKELIVLNDPISPVSEMFKTLRTNIQFMNSDKELKTLLISSTLPGEGKSWTAANLAATFSQAGKKVLIIDADMRKGRQFNIFGVPPTPGLSNYLSGVVDFKKKSDDINDFIQKTEIENLYILPAGNVPPNPSELLVSKKMIELIKKVKELFDITIFDGTPSLLVTDAPILSRIVDSTVLVTAHNETKIDNVAKVKKAIENVGGKVAGVVVNKIPVSVGKYEGNYYYEGYSSISPAVVNDKKRKHLKAHHEFFWKKKSKDDDYYDKESNDIKNESFKFLNETKKEEEQEFKQEYEKELEQEFKQKYEKELEQEFKQEYEKEPEQEFKQEYEKEPEPEFKQECEAEPEQEIKQECEKEPVQDMVQEVEQVIEEDVVPEIEVNVAQETEEVEFKNEKVFESTINNDINSENRTETIKQQDFSIIKDSNNVKNEENNVNNLNIKTEVNNSNKAYNTQSNSYNSNKWHNKNYNSNKWHNTKNKKYNPNKWNSEKNKSHSSSNWHSEKNNNYSSNKWHNEKSKMDSYKWYNLKTETNDQSNIYNTKNEDDSSSDLNNANKHNNNSYNSFSSYNLYNENYKKEKYLSNTYSEPKNEVDNMFASTQEILQRLNKYIEDEKKGLKNGDLDN